MLKFFYFFLLLTVSLISLVVVVVLYSFSMLYGESIKKTAEGVFSFSEGLENSLNDIGNISGLDERMIVRDEIFSNSIDWENSEKDVAKKLEWNSHTRCFYFVNTDEISDNSSRMTDDWIRLQLKSVFNK